MAISAIGQFEPVKKHCSVDIQKCLLRPISGHTVRPQSRTGSPEPHAFRVVVRLPDGDHQVEFEEHEHDHDDAQAAANRDHNIRSAYIHVIADAAVSVLATIGLLLARAFGWV
jgi:hypothetical protein